MEHESDGDTNSNWCTRYTRQKIDARAGRLGNKKTSANYPNYTIIKIGQNTQKSSGEFLRLAVTQTPEKNHQVILNNNNNNGENDTYKLLWSFDVRTDHLISARRPDLIIIRK